VKRKASQRGRMRRALALAAATLAVCTVSGCGLIGRPVAPIGATSVTMTVTSPDFRPGGPIPAKFTCRGGGESPAIFWSGAPAHTKSLALVVDDAAAPISPKVYWIVYNISPGTSDIPAGMAPPGAEQANNSRGHARYDPPCPVGSGHSYRFTVYALDSMLNRHLTSLRATWTAIARNVIARGRINGHVAAGG
jgi:Raf kinase inhibitor-like YbhB/YbcL family protein